MKEERVIDRLLKFAEWAKKGGMVKSRKDFERICGLSNNYLYNTTINTKSSVGTDHLVKIHAKFPQLNLVWVITGKGAMLTNTPDEGFREAYETMVKKVAELKKMINSI